MIPPQTPRRRHASLGPLPAEGRFLTKLRRGYRPEEMTDDLVLEPASSNEELRTVYYGGIPAPSGVYFLSARGAERGESAAVRFVLLRR